MVLDIGLNGRKALGRYALLEDLLAEPTLEKIVRSPENGLALFVAFKELFGKAAAFDPIQRSHLLKNVGAFFFETSIGIRHGTVCTIVHNDAMKKEKIKEFKLR